MVNIRKNLLGMLLVVFGIYILYTKNLYATSIYNKNSIENITPKEAYGYLLTHQNITVLDVRTLEEFEDDGYLSDAKNIPLNRLAQNLNRLDKNKKILVYCHTGHRSTIASQLLSKNGFNVLNVQGGISAWIDKDLPYEF